MLKIILFDEGIFITYIRRHAYLKWFEYIYIFFFLFIPQKKGS